MGNERNKYVWKKTFIDFAPGVVAGLYALGIAYVLSEYSTEQMLIQEAQNETIDIAKNSNAPEVTLDDMREVNPNAGYGQGPRDVETPGSMRTILNLGTFISTMTALWFFSPRKRNPNYRGY